MKYTTHPHKTVGSLLTLGTLALAGLIAFPNSAQAEESAVGTPGKVAGASHKKAPPSLDSSGEITNYEPKPPATEEEAEALAKKIEAREAQGIPEGISEEQRESLLLETAAWRADYRVWANKKQRHLALARNTIKKGTVLGEYIAANREACRERNINLFIAKEVYRLVVLQDIEAFGLEPEDVLQVLGRTGLPIQIETIKGAQGVSVIVTAAKAAKDAESIEVFSLRGMMPSEQKKVSDEIQEFTELMDKVEEAINDAVRFRTEGHPVKLTTHAPTKLLIVRGAPEDVAVAKKVVLALGGKSSQ